MRTSGCPGSLFSSSILYIIQQISKIQFSRVRIWNTALLPQPSSVYKRMLICSAKQWFNTTYRSARPSFLLSPSLPYSVMFPSASAPRQWRFANTAHWLPQKILSNPIQKFCSLRNTCPSETKIRFLLEEVVANFKCHTPYVSPYNMHHFHTTRKEMKTRIIKTPIQRSSKPTALKKAEAASSSLCVVSISNVEPP